MPSLRLGIQAATAYVAIVGIGTFSLFQVFGAATDIRGAMILLLPVQLLAVVFSLFIVTAFTGWQWAGFGKLKWGGMIWFLPAWAVLIFMFADIAEVLTLEDLRGLGLMPLILTTFLIAFGEEVLFRGVLLRGAMTTLTLPQAMMLSTILFGLFHYVNAFAGQDIMNTSQQVLFAALVGFFLAPIAVRVGNLWPLIVWHWLWNIAVLLSQVSSLVHPFVLMGIAVQSVVSILLWAEIVREVRAR